MNALLVEAIQDPAGTEVFDTSPEIDRWLMIGNDTANRMMKGTSDGEIIPEWRREDLEIDEVSITKVPVGTGMSCNGGVFSFPRTGLYKVDIMLVMRALGDESTYGATLKVSRDNGASYDNYARLLHACTQVDTIHHTVSASHFINVPAVEGPNAVVFKLESYSLDSTNINIIGDYTGDDGTTQGRGSCVSITKIGPAV